MDAIEEAPSWLQRAAAIAGDLLALVGVAFGAPLAILAIGLPIALLVRFLLWMGGAL